MKEYLPDFEANGLFDAAYPMLICIRCEMALWPPVRPKEKEVAR
jgi:hypothetical protein